jgi:hypothetical protein
MVKSETAVVTVAAGISNIFIVPSRTTGLPGLITMDGLLSDSAGNAIDGVTVKLNINGSDKKTFITKSWYPYPFILRNIWFEYTFPEGTFDIQAYWEGNAAYQGCSGSLIRATYAKVPTVIYPFTASPSTGAPPLDVSVAGLLKDNTGFALSAKSIDIYRDGTKIATALTSGGGVFTYLDRLTTVGPHTYQAEFKGDDTYAGCEEEPSEILPCPACGHLMEIRDVGEEVSCGFCGATSEIRVYG